MTGPKGPGWIDELMYMPQSSRTMRLLRILLVLLAVTFQTVAQTNAPGEVRQLSLQDCIQLALKHNLDLQIDRYNPELARFTLAGYYGAYDPAFNLTGSHNKNQAGASILSGGFSIPGSEAESDSFSSSLTGLSPWGTSYGFFLNPLQNTYGRNFGFDTNGLPRVSPFESSQGASYLSVSQPLLRNFWIDSTRLSIKVAKNRVKYSEQTLRLQLIDIITRLEKGYYDLIYNRENVIVQQKAVELAERLVVENRKKLEVGTLAPLDLQSAEAQAASTRAQVILAKSQLGTQERLLKQLITDEYAKWATMEIEPMGTLAAVRQNLNLQDSWSKGLAKRPELLQAKLDVERQGIQLRYDKNQLLPLVDIFGTYGYNGSGNEFSQALYDIQNFNNQRYSYGGSITMPLANITARNNVRASKATLQQLVLTLKKLEEGVMIDIDNDIGVIRSNFDQVQANRAAREYQEAALDAEQKKLASGKSTTYTVLQVQRDLTTARGNEIQALDNYNKSLADLSQHEGTTLERLGVDLQFK